mgnify:CR=1 FL=1
MVFVVIMEFNKPSPEKIQEPIEDIPYVWRCEDKNPVWLQYPLHFPEKEIFVLQVLNDFHSKGNIKGIGFKCQSLIEIHQLDFPVIPVLYIAIGYIRETFLFQHLDSKPFAAA